jgi:RNA polymerase sigma-70 factor (ECF subfamily)
MSNLNEQFGAIYDQYIEKIYRFVYLKVNTEEIAQDITSKVFLRAWEAYSKPKNEIVNMGAFLYKVAGNAVIDHYRERGRTNVVSSDAIPEVADQGADIHEKAIFNADISTIKRAIQKLQKDHQDIIIWHYLEDMPIKNIAELMDKPEGTIRVMLHRGLKSLRDIIQES